MKPPAFLLPLVLTLGTGLAFADYDEELWNDPLKANNHWSYYDTDAPQPHDVNMIWSMSGGVGNSGSVKSPLNMLDSAHNNLAYWPAYLYREIGSNQEVDLSFPGATIKIYARDVSTLSPLNLQGGALHFFIGQWLEIGGPGPEDDKWSFFYTLQPVTIASGKWDVESSIPAGTNVNWGTIASNDPGTSPDDLFYHPQQWGFVIYPAASTPSGDLALDSFRIVPEPAVLTLIGLGGLLAPIRRQNHRQFDA